NPSSPSLAAAAAVVPPSDNAAAEADLLCGGCRYNLRGIPGSSDRCPECGRRFDRNHLLRDLIPWEQRKTLGRFGLGWIKAFVATIWIGTIRIPTLAERIRRPVNGRDARRFRIY